MYRYEEEYVPALKEKMAEAQAARAAGNPRREEQQEQFKHDVTKDRKTAGIPLPAQGDTTEGGAGNP